MILAVNHIEKSYGIDTILENITFHIEEREKTAIVGVNGAGKTTLFRILTGEISADGGDVFLKRNHHGLHGTEPTNRKQPHNL